MGNVTTYSIFAFAIFKLNMPYTLLYLITSHRISGTQSNSYSIMFGDQTMYLISEAQALQSVQQYEGNSIINKGWRNLYLENWK